MNVNNKIAVSAFAPLICCAARNEGKTMKETITTNTTHWMKKGMTIWHSEPDKPTELRKVVKVINKTTAEIRPLRFYERWFRPFYKFYVLHIRNPIVRVIEEYEFQKHEKNERREDW